MSLMGRFDIPSGEFDAEPGKRYLRAGMVAAVPGIFIVQKEKVEIRLRYRAIRPDYIEIKHKKVSAPLELAQNCGRTQGSPLRLHGNPLQERTLRSHENRWRWNPGIQPLDENKK